MEGSFFSESFHQAAGSLRRPVPDDAAADSRANQEVGANQMGGELAGAHHEENLGVFSGEELGGEGGDCGGAEDGELGAIHGGQGGAGGGVE